MKHLNNVITVIISLLIFLTGCGSSSYPSAHLDNFTIGEDGTSILTDEGYNTAFPDKLPYDIKYNDAAVTIESVKAYENVSDYSHNLYVMVTLDIGDLTEEELHWLRESDMDLMVYLTHEDNGYDFDRMSLLGSLLYSDTERIYTVFLSPMTEENRFSFAGATLNICADIRQNQKYTTTTSSGKTLERNFVEGIQYETTLGTTITDAEHIPHPIYDYVVKWLYNRAEFFTP